MSGKSVAIFDKHLLEHMKAGRNNEATSMLNPDLAKLSDDFGTLLHYAVLYWNADITRHLIELGSEVDAIGKEGKTPLMRAVEGEYSRSEIVRMLLEAGANIDIADDSGKSPLQTVFERDIFQYPEIFQQFIHRVRADASSIEESASKLVDAGCKICHAVHLEDVQLLECMHERGAVEVNSLINRYFTPLHIAAQLGNEAVVAWLLDNGADVNFPNETAATPLHLAARRKNIGVMRLLLERGADPDVEMRMIGTTPLQLAIAVELQDQELGLECLDTECVELLIEYGAVSRDSCEYLDRIFNLALYTDRWPIIKLLVAHLAMLQKLGSCNAEAVLQGIESEFHASLERIRNDYKACQRTLDFVIFGTSTLFDLLNDKMNFSRLRTFVRNETFGAKVDQLWSELGDRYGYYYKSLMKNFAKARRIVELEDKAIPVICELFEGSYNRFFVFARQVVGYLSERDLEHLILV